MKMVYFYDCATLPRSKEPTLHSGYKVELDQ